MGGCRLGVLSRLPTARGSSSITMNSRCPRVPSSWPRNESGVQSFRTGRGLAVQFHPEMSGELLASWCREEGGAQELIAAGRDPDELIDESRYREVESQPALERMLDWFLDEVAGADQTSLGEG